MTYHVFLDKSGGGGGEGEAIGQKRNKSRIGADRTPLMCPPSLHFLLASTILFFLKFRFFSIPPFGFFTWCFFITSFILLKTRPQVKNNFKLHLRGKPPPIPIICQILIF